MSDRSNIDSKHVSVPLDVEEGFKSLKLPANGVESAKEKTTKNSEEFKTYSPSISDSESRLGEVTREDLERKELKEAGVYSDTDRIERGFKGYEDLNFRDSGERISVTNRGAVELYVLEYEGREYKGYFTKSGDFFYLLDKSELGSLYKSILSSRAEPNDGDLSENIASFTDKKTGLVFSYVLKEGSSAGEKVERSSHLLHEAKHLSDLNKRGSSDVSEELAYKAQISFLERRRNLLGELYEGMVFPKGEELGELIAKRYQGTEKLSLAAVSKGMLDSDSFSREEKTVYDLIMRGPPNSFDRRSIKEIFEEKIQSLSQEQIENVFRKCIKQCLKEVWPSKLEEILNDFNISINLLNQLQIDEEVRKGVITYLNSPILKTEELESILKYVDNIEEIFRHSEVTCELVKKLASEIVGDRLHKIDEIITYFQIERPTIEVAIRESFINLLDDILDSKGRAQYNITIAEQVFEKFNPDQDLYEDTFFQDKVEEVVIFLLEEGDLDLSKSVVKLWRLSDNRLANSTIQDLLIDKLVDAYSRNDSNLADIINTFNISNENQQLSIKKTLINSLESNSIDSVVKLVDRLAPSKETLQDSELQNNVKARLKKLIISEQLEDAKKIIEVFKPDKHLVGEAIGFNSEVELGVVNEISIKVIQDLALAEDYTRVRLALDYFKDLDTKDIVSSLIQGGYLDKLELEADIFSFGRFRKSSLAASKRASGDVRFTEWNLVESDFERVTKKERNNEFYERQWEKIKETKAWTAQVGAIEGFEVGAGYFGFYPMLRYSSAADVSRHDIFFAMESVVKLADTLSNIESYQDPKNSRYLNNAKGLFTKILDEVTADNSSYEEGSSYKRLNALSQGSWISPAELYQDIMSDSDFNSNEKLREKIEYYQEARNVLGSWKALKGYLEFCELFHKNKIEIIEITRLNNLALEQEDNGENKKAELTRKKAKFFEDIIYHPGGNVDLNALIEMFNNPEQFLERGDRDAPKELHLAKKPSNYINIPHLGLSGHGLINAFVSGQLDKLQVLPAVSYDYEFSNSKKLDSFLKGKDAEALYRECIGEEWGGILGNNGKKVYPIIQEIVNEGRDKAIKLRGSEKVLEALKDLSEKQQSRIISLLRAKLIEYGHFKVESHSYRVTVHRKSSPVSILAGNDTDCCMPFGSGKNNVYMFNPNCVQFTVQEMVSNEQGKMVPGRTVAQSVLTLNIDAKKNVPELSREFEVSGHLKDVVDESLLGDQARYVVCDSIEYNKNHAEKSGAADRLQVMYEDFFKRFFDSLPDVLQDGHVLNKEELFVSERFRGPFGDKLSQTENRYVPLAPTSYSDNMDEKARVIKPALSDSVIVNVVQEVDSNFGMREEQDVYGRVSDLTYRDSLHVSYLEGKIYSSLKSLISNLHNLENALIGKDIANEERGLGNLSLKYVDTEGRMRGYILAYEGRFNRESYAYSKLNQLEGDRLIYVSDFASLEESSLSSGKLLFKFMERYVEEYKGDGFPPIYMEAREGTSYKLLDDRHINSLERRFGIEIEKRVLQVEEREGEKFYHIVLVPKLKG